MNTKQVQRIIMNPTSRTIQFWYSQAPFCLEVPDTCRTQVMRFLFRTRNTWQNPHNIQRVTIYERS